MSNCSKCDGPMSPRNKYGVCKKPGECLKENMRLQSAAARARNPEAYKDHSRRSIDKRLGERPACKGCGLPTNRASKTGFCTRPTCLERNQQAYRAMQYAPIREEGNQARLARWAELAPIGQEFAYWTIKGIPFLEERQGEKQHYSVILVEAECACGIVRNVSMNALFGGNSNHCGCKPWKVERARTAWLVGQKVAAGKCVDCGLICTEENYFCFDWDHRPGVEKISHIASLIGHPQSVVLDEIAKCDLRCAICHRMVTHGRPSPPKGRKRVPALV